MPPRSSHRFAFGGRLSLDLTWTLAHRLWAPTEHLTRDGDVVSWLTAAGLSDGSAKAPRGILDATRELREAIYRSAQRRIAQRSMHRKDVDVINRWAQEPQPHPILSTSGDVTWRARDATCAALGAVAIDAVDLLAHPGTRLRECSREGCSALLYDASPSGRRRWCSAQRCGNVVNTTNYRRRRSKPAEGVR